MYGMMRGQKKRDSWREEEEGVLCGAMKKWDFFFRGERWDTGNLFSAHNRSYTNRAVGPCSTEDRTHEQQNEMYRFHQTTRNN